MTTPQIPHIIEYDAKYQPAFYALNKAWIEQYFALEPEDHAFLSDPVRHIIAPGGMVFFALVNGEAAGTCGVMRMDADTFELVRMSVDASHRGSGMGTALIARAAQWAAAQGACQLILETSSVLASALRLYARAGFEHYMPKPEHRSGLSRPDTFMRLWLPARAAVSA